MPLRAFATSRIAIFVLAAGTWIFVTPRSTGRLLDMWSAWDGQWFMRIAEHFYSTDPRAAPAFFPLYPGAVGVVGRVLLGRYALAGVVVSLVACAVAFVLLERLARVELGDAADAARAVLYLAVFPLSFFLQAVYSESLYLALAVGAFLAARRERWGLAALACAACCLTRPTGLAVVAGVLVLAWRSPARRRAVPLVAVSPAAIGLFTLELAFENHDAGALLHAERVWGRTFMPLGGLWHGAAAAWHGVTGTTATPHAGLSATYTGIVNLDYSLWLVVFVALAVLTWRRFGAAYGVFAALSLLLPLCYPSDKFPLFSMSRLGMVVFPFFFVLAQLGRDRRVSAAIVAVSVALLGYYTVRWAHGYWVA